MMQKIFISAIQYFLRNKDREYWPTGKICLITDRKNSNPYRGGNYENRYHFANSFHRTLGILCNADNVTPPMTRSASSVKVVGLGLKLSAPPVSSLTMWATLSAVDVEPL